MSAAPTARTRGDEIWATPATNAAASHGGCCLGTDSDCSAYSGGALTEMTAHEEISVLELPPSSFSLSLLRSFSAQEEEQRRQETPCGVASDGEGAGCAETPDEAPAPFVLFSPRTKAANSYFSAVREVRPWHCGCDGENDHGGCVIGATRGDNDPHAEMCPVAQLQGVLRRPVRLHLHQHSAGGTYMVLPPEAAPKEKKGGPILAVFKPCMEEIGQQHNPHGNCVSERSAEFVPGTGSAREVLAYLLDHEGSAGVVPTIEVRATTCGAHRGISFSQNTVPHEGSVVGGDDRESDDDASIGSLQYFVPGCVEAADLLPGSFAVDDVHRIAIFDIRTLNGDRHGGNVLVRRTGTGNPVLVPIDHSYICPSGFADPDFEWLYWPQAKIPFSGASLEYIARLSPARDAELVRGALWLTSPGKEAFAIAAAEVIRCTTRLLQIAALQYNLSAYDIGFMCRRNTLALPSFLEELMGVARDDMWRVHLPTFEVLLSRRLQDCKRWQ